MDEMDRFVINPKVVTIGVFGYRKEAFFQALRDARVDLLIDIRRRRALRNKAYRFANSTRLQTELTALGIRYLHRLDLAPSYATRQVQAIHDRLNSVTQYDRQTLAPDFVAAYQQECLADFDVQRFLDQIGPETRTFALFCVERTPAACHRSLVAAQLASFGLDVVHLIAG
jgi:uncharacterized protein (DUF488 family)